MSGIKSRLNLYSGSKKSERDNNAEKSAPVLLDGLRGFELVAAGVYRKQENFIKPEFGHRSLNHYFPLSVTGILELSFIETSEYIHPEEVIFLDTETTGLSRGTGIIPFLTGLAWFTGNQINVEQFFLADPGGEESYLDFIINKLNSFPYIATYNGKSFDIPVLRNRMILNRRQSNSPVYHFDLLHIMRRLIAKGSVSGYSQQSMETFLLGKKRENDIPGAEIPQVYFDYTKYGIRDRLENVIEHNGMDMIGMMFLFLESVYIYEDRFHKEPGIRTGIARILARKKKYEEAISLLQSLRAEELEGPLRYKNNILLATLLKRDRQYIEAEKIYRIIINEYNCQYATLALARIYEHKLNRLHEALKLVNKLINSNSDNVEFFESLEKRKNRLKRKLANLNEPQSIP